MAFVMKNTSVFLIQLSDKLHNVAKQAAEAVFPQVTFISANTVAEAKKSTAQGRQLMVLGEVAEADVNAAAQATDGEDLPRWAVVTFGRSSTVLAESLLPYSECNTQLLGRVFRSVVLQHELLRENLGLRGDLKTVAHRFSHDLRSPLNCIHITTELMKELSAKNDPQLLAQIQVIQNSIVESFKIIDRFSYVLNASTEPIPPVPISMDGVVSRVLAKLEEEMHPTAIAIQTPPNWPVVEGVAQWLERIWMDLILNASQHGRPSKPIKLGWSQHDVAWRFWVENQGTPVPADFQAKLFNRFEQLHTHSISGLGLAMVQRLVALQGGQCGYERPDPELSVFYFTLPRKNGFAETANKSNSRFRSNDD